MDIETDADIDTINNELDVVNQSYFVTPQIALERVRNILSMFDIDIPTVLLEQTTGEQVFQVEDEDLFIYFGYTLLDNMIYEIYAELMDGDDLQDFMSDDDDDEEED